MIVETQPPQSPDFNIMDLSIWYSLQSQVHRVRFAHATNGVLGVRAALHDIYDSYPSDKVVLGFGGLWANFNACFAHDGDNRYPRVSEVSCQSQTPCWTATQCGEFYKRWAPRKEGCGGGILRTIRSRVKSVSWSVCAMAVSIYSSCGHLQKKITCVSTFLIFRGSNIGNFTWFSEKNTQRFSVCNKIFFNL